jgi:hypothetical protein
MSEIYNGQEIRPYDSAPAVGSNPVNSVESGGGGGGGTSWFSGLGPPSAGIGSIGDFFFDTSNVAIYGPKTISGWGTAIPLEGSAGAPGQGVPAGGATGQVLKKVNSADFNTQWADDLTGGGGGSGATNLTYDAPGRTVVSDTGTDAVLPLAGANPGLMTSADKSKLDAIEAGATADMTNGEVENAYNAQVPAASQVEAEAGTSTSIRRWTPQRVAQAIAALAPGGGGGLDTAAGDARYLKLDSQPVTLGAALGGRTSAITESTTTPLATIYAPFAFTLTELRAILGTPESAQVTIVDVHLNGTSIMPTTKLTIDANENTSVTAAVGAVIGTTAIPNNARLDFFADDIGTVGRDLQVWMLGYRTVVNQIPPPAPTAPLQVGTITPTTGDTQIALTWTAPGNGGSSITDYVVEQSLNGTSGWTVAAGGSVSAAPGQTVTGLTNATSYYFRVAAVNAIGQGPYSAVSGPHAPSAGGTGPTITSVFRDTNTAIITYTAFSGGGTVDTVEARMRVGAGAYGDWVPSIDIASPTSFNFAGQWTGVTDVEQVTYQIRAKDIGGTVLGTSAEFTPAATVNPTIFYVDLVDGAGTLEFYPSEGTVTSYQWRYRDAPSGSFTAWQNSSPTNDTTTPLGLSDMIGSLPTGGGVFVQIRAMNGSTPGNVSAEFLTSNQFGG